MRNGMILFCLLGWWYLATACADPLGVSNREQIRQDGQQAVAEIETAGKVAVAQQQKEADIGVAREQRKASQYWASTLPILLIIIAVAGFVWLLTIYRGRTAIELAKHGLYLPDIQQTPPPPPLPSLQHLPPNHRQLEAQAAHRGQRIEWHVEEGKAYLIDQQTNQVVGQKQLTDTRAST